MLSAALLAAYRGDTDTVQRLISGVDIPDTATAGLPMRTWFLRTTSSVRYAAGEDSGAYDDVLESLELDPSGVNAPTSMWAGVQAASMLRDAARLERILDVAGSHQGRWVALVRQTGAGVLAALHGSDHGESVIAGPGCLDPGGPGPRPRAGDPVRSRRRSARTRCRSDTSTPPRVTLASLDAVALSRRLESLAGA